MTMMHVHAFFYDHIFRMPRVLQDPVLVFGYHELHPSPPRARLRNTIEFWWKRYQPKGGVWLHSDTPPAELRSPTLHEALRKYGAGKVSTLDLFDRRADFHFDMNEPIPAEHHGAFRTFIDIGSIEHVFDTRQCLENMFRLVQVGGHVVIHTPCAGYYNHGLHTFSPECLLQAFEINGFTIRWVSYCTPTGLELDSPKWFRDVLIWFVAEKTASCEPFQSPQQGRWAIKYQKEGHGTP